MMMEATHALGFCIYAWTILPEGRGKIAERATESARQTEEHGPFTNAEYSNEIMTNDEFNMHLGEITRLWHAQDLLDALAKIDETLPILTDEQKSKCLLFSGMIRRQKGDLDRSLNDWLMAIPMSDKGSFLRYSLQANIAELYESTGDYPNASKWYLDAIATNAYGDNFSGEKSLMSFLDLNQGKIGDANVTVVSKSLVKSWSALNLPGEPDLSEIDESIRRLSAGFAILVESVVQEE